MALALYGRAIYTTHRMKKKEEEKKKTQVTKQKSTGPKKLYRSRTDVVIGGVAAGLGEYFDIDASIIRLVFILTVFFGGFGIPLYIILWIIIPAEPKDSVASEATVKHNVAEIKEKANGFVTSFRNRGLGKVRNIFAVILIGIGAIILLDNFGVFRGDIFWPALLIIVGLLFLRSK